MENKSFLNLINNIEKDSKQAVLSELFLRDDVKAYIGDMLNTGDGLLAEPVFEPMFEWEKSNETFQDLSGNLFPKSFIDNLDKGTNGEYRFGKHFNPYKHQLAAWRALKTEKKSIIVSSGTGSGKTEAFLMPIISDMVEQTEQSGQELKGVQALFLYPLNALIQSQKNRFSNWLAHYKGKIRYCLYNSMLPDKPLQITKEMKDHPEEVYDRANLRKNPPPLLVTNITMLEYMLLRKEDAGILQASQGKLKYIVLDEAHTYIGSQSSELSLLLKRVINAFGVKRENVQFIATSATIGGKNSEIQLRKFLADIAGISEQQVKVIFGTRRIDKIETKTDNKLTLSELEQAQSKDKISLLRNNKLACQMRNFFINSTGTNVQVRTLDEFCKEFNLSKEDGLKWLDLLSCDRMPDESLFLPLRIHLFHKTFPGIWCCCNEHCEHKPKLKDWPYGNIYLKERYVCDCGAPVYRMVMCSDCGNMVLRAVLEEKNKGEQRFLLPDVNYEPEEYNDEGINEIGVCYIDNRSKGMERRFLNVKTCEIETLKTKDNIEIGWFQGKCNVCNSDGDSFKNKDAFFSGQFFLSIVLPTLLQYSPQKLDPENPFDGKRMLCFNDSRQGTAKTAIRLQQLSENMTFRSELLSAVAKTKNVDKNSGLTAEQLRTQGIPEDMIQIIMQQQAKNQAENAQLLTWENLRRNTLRGWINNGELRFIKNLYDEKDFYLRTDDDDLLDILFYREMHNRPKLSNNMETMGLLSTVYDFRSIKEVPEFSKQYFKDLNEYKDFLKIILDFYIRARNCVSRPAGWHIWGGFRISEKIVLPLKSEIKDSNKEIVFPCVRDKGQKFNIIKFLELALDLDSDKNRGAINEIMQEAWDTLVEAGILEAASGGERAGRIMKITTIGLKRPEKAYVCPITHRVIDVALRGLSPYCIKPEHKNLKCEEIKLPLYDYDERTESAGGREQWFKDNIEQINDLKKRFIWNNQTDKIIKGNRFFRIVEHSAQQDPEKLHEYESRFNEGRVNVLNCSTTMEMGVDIKHLAVVAMNNVPPHPANYLQRAGRAGRSGESKAFAFTLCKNDPHEEYVFNNPKWAFETEINVPDVENNSEIILQRHINSFLLASFLKQENSNKINLTTEWFLLEKENDKNKLKEFQKFCDKAIQNNPDIIDGINNIISRTPFQNRKITDFVIKLKDMLQEFERNWFAVYDAADKQLEELKAQDEYEEKDAAIKSLEYRIKRLKKEYLLTNLIQEGILPRHGFPINLVVFDKSNSRHQRKNSKRGRVASYKQDDEYNDKEDKNTREDISKKTKMPSRNIAIALREYAPGAHVAIDGLIYTSRGITLNWHVPAEITQENELREIQNLGYLWACPCGASGTSRVDDIECRVCHKHIEPENIKKYIQPAGFAVDFCEEPTTTVSDKNYNDFVPASINIYNKYNSYLAENYVQYRSDKESSMINKTSKTYDVCLRCGRVERSEPGLKKDHKNLYGKTCDHGSHSIQRGLLLAAEEKTDALELKLKDVNNHYILDKVLARTLAVAIRAGIAQFMGVENQNIGCDIKKGLDAVYSIVLYDVSASGYTSSNVIINNLAKIMELARNTLKCDCQKCCNKCLLQTDTKYKFDELDRNVGLEFLTDKWINLIKLQDKDKLFGETTQIETRNLADAIKEDLPTDNKNVYLFVDKPIGGKDGPFFDLIYELNSDNSNRLTLCVDKNLMSDNTTVSVLNELGQLQNVSIEQKSGDVPEYTMAAITKNGVLYAWASSDDSISNFGPDWGKNDHTSVVCGQIQQFKETKIDLPKPHQDFITELDVQNELNVSMYDFGDNLLRLLETKYPNLINTEISNIVYKDRYFKTPFVVGLFMSFVKAMKDNYGQYWHNTHVSIETLSIQSESSTDGIFVYNDWDSSENRNAVIKSLGEKCGINIDVVEKNKQKLAHYRAFEINFTDGHVLTLGFDCGFGYWKCSNVDWNSKRYLFTADADTQADAILNNDIRVVGNDFHETKISIKKQ